MKYWAPILCGLVAFAVISVAEVVSAADPPHVIQSITIDPNGNADAVLGEAAKTRAIFKRLGIDATRRYYQATLAGASTGSLVLAIEYPSLVAYATAQQKLAGDDEWQAYVEKLTGQDISIESNSIWVEVAAE